MSAIFRRFIATTLAGGFVMSMSACSADTQATADVSNGLLDWPEVCEPPVQLATLPAELHEASGIARDPRRDDLFWAHNDSGNDPELYAMDLNGNVLDVVPVVGATDRDLEDIAIGPCPGGNCLYLADIGDNLAVHPTVMVHRLPLPSLPNSSGADEIETPPIAPDASWRLVYEDGARDAESLVVDPERLELVVVSKGRNGEIVLYAVPLADLQSRATEPDTLRRIGRLPLPIGVNSGQFVTAADLSPDASTLAVRSYTTLYQFAWNGSATFDSTTAPSWTSLIPAREAQGEGMSWDASGETLVLVSEGRGGIPPSFSRLRCPVAESSWE
ncbi:MAG: hypothetical protein ACE5FP_07235 [Gemmatimonadota bacterium]